MDCPGDCREGESEDNVRVREFTTRLSEDKTHAVISITIDGVPLVGGDVTAWVRLTREQAWQLGQTLILMTGGMRDSKAGE